MYQSSELIIHNTWLPFLLLTITMFITPLAWKFGIQFPVDFHLKSVEYQQIGLKLLFLLLPKMTTFIMPLISKFGIQFPMFFTENDLQSINQII